MPIGNIFLYTVRIIKRLWCRLWGNCDFLIVSHSIEMLCFMCGYAFMIIGIYKIGYRYGQRDRTQGQFVLLTTSRSLYYTVLNFNSNLSGHISQQPYKMETLTGLWISLMTNSLNLNFAHIYIFQSSQWLPIWVHFKNQNLLMLKPVKWADLSLVRNLNSVYIFNQ